MHEKYVGDEVHTMITGDETRDMGTDAIPFDIHEQYLDRLYRQYNIQVHDALLFYIENETEPVIFVNKTEIDIGRTDAKGRIRPEFDLSEYGGAERGISRLHAKIINVDDNFLIQDLHSTNQTWLNGYKLVPYQYSPLHDGSIIQLGRLAMTVFIIKK